MRDPMSFGVGESLFSPTFTVTPDEMWAWQRAKVLGSRDDRPNFRSRLERPVDHSQAPEGLVLAKLLDAIGQSENLGGCALVPTTGARRLRLSAPVVVGERLSAVATVRFRSIDAGRTFITLAIELRADQGLRRLAALEVSAEVWPELGLEAA